MGTGNVFRLISVLLLLSIVHAGHGLTLNAEECNWYCNRGERDARCKGLKTSWSRLIKCLRFRHSNRWALRGPPGCKHPTWRLSRNQAVYFFPLRVCRREIICIQRAGRLPVKTREQRALMAVLNQRARNYAVMDEIRFARNPNYVRSVDAMTNDKFISDLKYHVRKKGFEYRTQFANPVFRENERYFKENARLRKLLSVINIIGTLRERDQERARFDAEFPTFYHAVRNAQSRLKSTATKKQVAQDLASINKYAKYIRQLQKEAFRLQFFKKEFILVSKDVRTRRASNNALKAKLDASIRFRTLSRLRVSQVKKRLTERIRAATDEVAKAQNATCT